MLQANVQSVTGTVQQLVFQSFNVTLPALVHIWQALLSQLSSSGHRELAKEL